VLKLEARVLGVRARQLSGDRSAAQRLAHEALSLPGSARYRAELQAIIDALPSRSPSRPVSSGGSTRAAGDIEKPR
jgi:hypothetical protein